ncbi:protein D1-like [Episyrphus balteatus]|uniref:protein D1-like n=1 Tax=Episyrphus balteatus TaxID=286459 RepID=UPI002485B4C9|nr:protein D1-like [Episyrphus balteatus]
MSVRVLTFSFIFSLYLSFEVVSPHINQTNSKMQEAGIVPDVIDVAPTKVVQVTYPNGLEVNQGNELTPTQVKNQPTVHWDAEENALYTLLMTDPDASEQFREVRHWLVVNIPGNKVSEGQSVVDYVGSGPPLGSGKHRYIFLVFKQPNEIKTSLYISKKTRTGRTSTKARDLIKEYNLGNPVAGNFYLAEYDDYVPILHAGFTN